MIILNVPFPSSPQASELIFERHALNKFLGVVRCDASKILYPDEFLASRPKQGTCCVSSLFGDEMCDPFERVELSAQNGAPYDREQSIGGAPGHVAGGLNVGSHRLQEGYDGGK
jgi:hypothetical protein